MLVVIEGVSAAGKTTRAARHAPAVVEELCAIEPAADARTIGEFWSDRHSQRWMRGLVLEAEHGVAVFDTDPLKIHYAWCLWQIGEGGREIWRATVDATRKRLIDRQIGFADQILLLEPPDAVVRRQQVKDSTRRRRRFELHLRLRDPLRRWYETMEAILPGRVIFNADRASVTPPAVLRDDRYSVEDFDAFIAALDRSAG